jgi:hypothetical protein
MAILVSTSRYASPSSFGSFRGAVFVSVLIFVGRGVDFRVALTFVAAFSAAYSRRHSFIGMRVRHSFFGPLINSSSSPHSTNVIRRFEKF